MHTETKSGVVGDGEAVVAHDAEGVGGLEDAVAELVVEDHVAAFDFAEGSAVGEMGEDKAIGLGVPRRLIQDHGYRQAPRRGHRERDRARPGAGVTLRLLVPPRISSSAKHTGEPPSSIRANMSRGVQLRPGNDCDRRANHQ